MFFEQIMPPFRLRKFWLKFYMQVIISKTNADIELKLHMCLRGYKTSL